MKTLNQHWNEYVTGCFPKGLSDDLQLKLHNAFINGASVLLIEIDNIANSNMPESESDEALNKLADEVKNYLVSDIQRMLHVIGNITNRETDKVQP